MLHKVITDREIFTGEEPDMIVPAAQAGSDAFDFPSAPYTPYPGMEKRRNPTGLGVSEPGDNEALNIVHVGLDIRRLPAYIEDILTHTPGRSIIFRLTDDVNAAVELATRKNIAPPQAIVFDPVMVPAEMKTNKRSVAALLAMVSNGNFPESMLAKKGLRLDGGLEAAEALLKAFPEAKPIILSSLPPDKLHRLGFDDRGVMQTRTSLGQIKVVDHPILMGRRAVATAMRDTLPEDLTRAC